MPKGSNAQGPKEMGFCPECHEIFLKEQYARYALEERLKNPYVRRVYTEFHAETGIYLPLYNLDVLQKVNQHEIAGNFDKAYKTLADNNRYFPKQNSVTISDEATRLAQRQNEKVDSINEQKDKSRQEKIDRLILCGRYEEAAIEYEKLGMWKEAGDTRRMERTVKNVNVDLNKLIEDIRQGGIGMQYRCPNCGASIPFKQSDVGAMKNCAYCGATIDTESMMKIIKEAIK